jgi:hypothetical protein
MVMCAMWNLTPDYIQQVKEELKGRRAAVEARVADELKAIAADLEEIETLERIAYSFAVKHLPEPQPVEAPGESVEVAALQAEPVSVEPEAEAKGLSRWRMRLDSHSESEPA